MRITRETLARILRDIMITYATSTNSVATTGRTTSATHRLMRHSTRVHVLPSAVIIRRILLVAIIIPVPAVHISEQDSATMHTTVPGPKSYAMRRTVTSLTTLTSIASSITITVHESFPPRNATSTRHQRILAVHVD